MPEPARGAAAEKGLEDLVHLVDHRRAPAPPCLLPIPSDPAVPPPVPASVPGDGRRAGTVAPRGGPDCPSGQM
ncbi:hypothetical protein GCM10017687_78420 [Streptomyces echinatus]